VLTLVPDMYAQHTHQFLTVCSVHASVPNVYDEGIQNEHLKNGKTDVHAEHACVKRIDEYVQSVHQFLTPMLSVNIGACA
jgi:hypothetical protein